MNNLNKPRHYSTNRFATTLCLSGLLALLAAGCGGSADPLETTEQDTSSTKASNENAASDDALDSSVSQPNSGGDTRNQAPIGALPPNASGGGSSAAGGSMLAPSSLVEQEQCSSGWLRTDVDPDVECAATFGGLCFEDDDAACQCAGCGDATCIILESYPTQIACETPPPGCNYRVAADECYFTPEEACEAAGCNMDVCSFDLSYPAMVSCEANE